jgi:hypothetical protein
MVQIKVQQHFTDAAAVSDTRLFGAAAQTVSKA